MKRISIIFVFLVFSPSIIHANEVIVRFNQEMNSVALQKWTEKHNLRFKSVISRTLNIYLFESTDLRSSARETSKVLRADPHLSYAQENHPVKFRMRTPNDSDFSKQWGLNGEHGINAPQAWDHSTGGRDAFGNEIVVAVVDGGAEVEHQSLEPNIWTNSNEISGNSIDDDGNGYVDDIHGWNAGAENGSIPSDSHGTHVSGIVGAKGNDHLQVTGVNWDVKVMVVGGFSGTTAEVLRAYSYVLDQKKLWLETQGEKGANVVASNSSFGIDYADCNSSEYQAWNDIYTEMGELGILNAGATANLNIDIDEEGDVPTGCESYAMISVTNTQENGTKYHYAGYGKRSVDLGAPGTEILSTVNGNSTASYSGTSMATPHVAGAVALLHSGASPAFSELHLNQPGESVRQMKEILLSTVASQEDLTDTVASGGRLDLSAAMEAIRSWEMKWNQSLSLMREFFQIRR